MKNEDTTPPGDEEASLLDAFPAVGGVSLAVPGVMLLGGLVGLAVGLRHGVASGLLGFLAGLLFGFLTAFGVLLCSLVGASLVKAADEWWKRRFP
jgi:hypothetical protein